MKKYKSAKHTLDELTKKYDRDPKGWRMAIGQDERGYFDIFLSNPTGVWQVKVDSIYKPLPIGLGTKIGGKMEAKRIASEKAPSFGFRPVSQELIENIMHYREKDMSPIMDEILKLEPRRLADIKSPVFASGPINYGRKFQLSSKQTKLDFELRKNLRRLLYKEGAEQEFG
jgi:hypothetical protein